MGRGCVAVRNPPCLVFIYLKCMNTLASHVSLMLECWCTRGCGKTSKHIIWLVEGILSHSHGAVDRKIRPKALSISDALGSSVVQEA